MQQSQNSLTWNLLIEGLVQGVGYRRFAQWSAERLKLTGWTRNLSDGRVEIRVSGSAETLAIYLMDLKRGPRHSQVRGIEQRPIPFEEFAEFEIRETI